MEASTSYDNTQIDCEDMKFSDFCKFCEKMSGSKSRMKKMGTLERFFGKYRSERTSFFPIMRLLLPQWDRERGAYGLREHNLAKKYIRILCLPDKDPDAQKLLHFKAPSKAGSSAGDFAAVVHEMMITSCLNRDSDLTIYKVNEILTEMAIKNSNKDPRGVESELSKLIDNMSATEQKWLIRILLKSMHLGVGYRVLLATFHPDAPEMHDVCSNLTRVCDVLKDRSQRLNEVEVRLFEPFRPMLSQRCDVQKLSINEPHFLETKWDGERFQLHYSDGKFRYYSRNGYDFTFTYGANQNSGYFTPKIFKQFKSSVNSCILDGEMMGWNTRIKKFGTKAMNFDVKQLREENIMQPCLVVFDVVYFNGLVLTNKPYHERMFILSGIFEPLEGVIIQTESVPVETTDEVLKGLNDAIDNREEGIVIKHPDSLYKPNGRNHGWMKIKPEYTEGAIVDMDLIIIGGYYGEGRKSGAITQFLLALKKEYHIDPNCEEGNFLALSKVGSGLNDKELEEVGSVLQPHWIRYKSDSIPDCLDLGKEKPDFIILPKNSIVLQIRATEVINSGDWYPTGYSLRFVRVQKIRSDKPWYDTLSVDEFHAIRRNYGGKLTMGHIVTLDDLPKGGKRKRKADQNSMESKVLVEIESKIFLGKEFFVASASNDMTVQDVKNTILKHSGNVVETHGSGTFCSLAGNINVRVNNLKASKVDIVKHCWVLRCLENAKLMPLLIDDFISMNEHTNTIITTFYDTYRNNADGAPTYQHICEVIDKFENYMDNEMSIEEVGPLYYFLYKNAPSNLFYKQKIYFDIYSEIGNKDILDIPHLANEMYYFKMFGGTIMSTITIKTTHVVMHEKFNENLEKFNKIKKSITTFEIVNCHWIIDSIVSGKLENSSDYDMNLQPQNSSDSHMNLQPQNSSDHDMNIQPNNSNDFDMNLQPQNTTDYDMNLQPQNSSDYDMNLQPQNSSE